MTPQEILELSEPVEAIYTDVTTQLIWNICKRLGQGKELKNWQAKKLGELDALTKDAVKIISNSTGKAQLAIKSTLAKALGIELKDVEAILKGAVQAGKIPDIGFTVEQSQGLKQLLQSLSDQAVDQTNLVNTVMLNSTRQRYVWAVNNTVQEEQKLIEKLYSARNYDELEQQTAKVQRALNRAAGTVEAGAEARVQALSRTVKELAQEGITGYIDRGGHHWSPEAYINMDIRTTVHNAAIQAQRTRAEEYGVETFQISSHAGARPLCAPYQGKFYSWDGSSGVLHDLYGKEYYYESIGNTSYGEPAGIFGINCGHDPITFVDGYNIPRYEETKDAEANAAEYRESQKQRYYEREVRQAKLEAIAQDAAGNKDAFNKAAAKVRQANANYKEFCKETGRTPRHDRLQVYTSEQGNGYNRSMSGKVTGTTRGWTPPEAKETVAKIYKPSHEQNEYGRSINEIYKNGNETFKKVWEKFLPNGGVVEDYHYTGPLGQHHYRGKVWLDADADSSNKRGAGITYFHEHGHAIDFLAGKVSSKDSEFIKALHADYDAARKATGLQNKQDQDFAIGMKLLMIDKDKIDKYNGVSDLMGGLSGGFAVGKYSHRLSYWKRKDSIPEEAFAHMVEAMFYEGQRNAMQEYFPTAYKRFIEMIKELL